MFESATLKLTSWYLLIIMVISLIFSILVYQSSYNELNTRFQQLGSYMPSNRFRALREAQIEQAGNNLLTALLYINCLVLGTGGVASYLMARRTLRPIQEAHEAESRFVSDASHELRTPLAAMKTEIEVALRDKNITAAHMRELLESNLEEVNKLTRLSQTLLDLSKLNFAKLTHERLPLNTIVKDVVKRYSKTTDRIKLKQWGRALMVSAHQSSIEDLFNILIDNALKYSPPGSKVTIKLSKRYGKACFEIINSGQGISSTDLPHIFDRFYRADNARTNKDKSSFGLGLSLAKTIVELHRGELSATSAPHAATTFTVLLPLYRNNPVKNNLPDFRKA